MEYIRHSIHHPDNPNTHWGIAKKDSIDTLLANKKNFYTQEDLSEAIKIMSEIIGARDASKVIKQKS